MNQDAGLGSADLQENPDQETRDLEMQLRRAREKKASLVQQSSSLASSTPSDVPKDSAARRDTFCFKCIILNTCKPLHHWSGLGILKSLFARWVFYSLAGLGVIACMPCMLKQAGGQLAHGEAWCSKHVCAYYIVGVLSCIFSH